MDALNALSQSAEEVLASLRHNPQFDGYGKATNYISRYLDHFGIRRDNQACNESLTLFYLAIKLADDDLDYRGKKREDLAGILDGTDTSVSDAASLLVHALRQKTLPNIASVSYAWNALWQSAYQEKDARTMQEYVKKRRAVGRTAAEATCEVILPHTRGPLHAFKTFFVRAGETAIVVDTVMDLEQDQRRCELPFTPSWGEKAWLYRQAFTDTASMTVDYPFILRDVVHIASKWLRGKYKNENTSN